MKKTIFILIILFGMILIPFSTISDKPNPNNEYDFLTFELIYNNHSINFQPMIDIFDNHNKYSFNFVSPINGNIQILMHFNQNVLSVHKDTIQNPNSIYFKFEGYEQYFYINWSDISIFENVKVKFKNNNTDYYMEFTFKNLSNNEYYEFDPVFGDAMIFPFRFTTENIWHYIRGNYYLNNQGAGIGDNITIYYYIKVGAYETAQIKCALYDKNPLSCDATDQVGITEQWSYGGFPFGVEQYGIATLDFTGFPSILDNTNYFILALGNVVNGEWGLDYVSLVRSAINPVFDNAIVKASTYPTYPDPIIGETPEKKDYIMNCAFTIPSEEIIINVTITNIQPFNVTINYYFCNDTFYIVFTVNVSSGGYNNITVIFDNETIYNSNKTFNRTIQIDIYKNYSKELYYDTNYSYSINATCPTNYTNKSGWINTGLTVYCSSLAFETGQFYLIIHIVLFSIILGFAEWKRDFIYFMASAIISIEFGYYLSSISEIHILFTVILFIFSAYFMTLSFGYIPFFKKYFEQFRQYFDFGHNSE